MIVERVNLRERLAIRLANLVPRSFAYWCGVRILREVAARPKLSKVARELYAGNVKMLHALESFINARQ